jgi:cysteinyl-tRNA synthetase
MAIQIHNVLSRNKEIFTPINEGEIRMYDCWVTVYGRSHVGHLRCYLSFDAIIRYMRYRGYDVKYVRNFTDIDDKIIARAKEIEAGPNGKWRGGEAYENYDENQWKERFEEDEKILAKAAFEEDKHLAQVVSGHFIDVFTNEDFGPFNLIQPMEEPRVSDHVPEVISLIEKIIERGFAYDVDGEVYFDVPAYHDATKAYGKLSGRDYTQLMEGARVRPTDKKRSGQDFALWKGAASGEPAWDSPWGPGRPGWHIECSAMSVDKLGQPFDIHGGGKDLIFPHHENEIAQSEAALGKTFCNIWMHNGFVTVDGVKMSKSLGNFITIKDALELAPPEVWRLLMLGTHYANPIDLSRTREVSGDKTETVRGTIDIAFDRLEYFYETLKRAEDLLAGVDIPEDVVSVKVLKKYDVLTAFGEVMDDDFNTAKALADIGEGMRLVNELADMKAKKIKKLDGGRPAWLCTIKEIASELGEAIGVLGLCTLAPEEALGQLRDFSVHHLGLDTTVIEAKIVEREEARKAKDWARSDGVRDALKEMGVELRDSPTGTAWKVVR